MITSSDRPYLALRRRRGLWRVLCAGAVVLLAVLSLLPVRTMVRSGFSPWGEHVMAYAMTAVLFSFAFGWRPRLGLLYFMLILYAGGLEAAQMLSPGRHAAVVDFFGSSLGVVLGGAFSWVAVLGMRRPRPGR